MQNELVSILMPFKNSETFLKECIESILLQSFSNWELLAIDDGSTDESFSILKNFSNQDTRIKVYKSQGQGIIDALRQAFQLCKGCFITRMDSDDIMAERKLEVMTDQLNNYETGHVALGLVKYFSEDGIGKGYSNYEKWLNRLTTSGANYAEIYKECVIPSPCWMVHREDFKKANAFESHRYPEDYDLAFRFYEHGLKCIPSNELLHYWRDYPSRTSRTHEHYAQNYFLDIKIHYFLKLDYNAKRPLAVWGAGYKGKTIANYLIEYDIPFHWVCDNQNKIGKDIYGQILHSYEFLKTLKNLQIIVTVANTEAQKEIRHYLSKLKMHPAKDYFFFC